MIPKRVQQRCTCPHGERGLGKLHGVNMGRGMVRLATTPGCPEHDCCHHFTAAYRAEHERWGKHWCPKHTTKDCPS